MKVEDHNISFEIAVEPENRAVSQSTEGWVKNNLHDKYRSGLSSLHVLNQLVMVVAGGVGFKRFSPFYDTFNDIIGRHIAVGFANTFDKLLSPRVGTKADDIGPQVLTLEQLGLGFIACLIPLGLSTVVFLIEIVVNRAAGRCVGCT